MTWQLASPGVCDPRQRERERESGCVWGERTQDRNCILKITYLDQWRYNGREYKSMNTNRWGSLAATLAAAYPSTGLGRGSDSGPQPEDGSESCAWLMKAEKKMGKG